MATASCSFTVPINDEEKPQIDETTCPPAVVGTIGSPPWPTVTAVDNSGDGVEIKALLRLQGKHGVETTEVTAESAEAGVHVYTFRAEDSSGNTAECSAPIGLW